LDFLPQNLNQNIQDLLHRNKNKIENEFYFHFCFVEQITISRNNHQTSTHTIHKNTFDNIIMARVCIGNQNLKSVNKLFNIPSDHIYFLIHPLII